VRARPLWARHGGHRRASVATVALARRGSVRRCCVTLGTRWRSRVTREREGSSGHGEVTGGDFVRPSSSWLSSERAGDGGRRLR
jgi:hypothetical protein